MPKKNSTRLLNLLKTGSPSGIENFFEEERLKKEPVLSAKVSVDCKLIYSIFPNYDIPVNPETIPDELKAVNIPLIFWGAADYFSKYASFRNNTGLGQGLGQDSQRLSFLYSDIYTADLELQGIQFDFLVELGFETGDLLIIYTYDDGAGGLYFIYVKVGTQEIPYGTLLSHINLDHFIIDKVKFSFESPTDNQLNIPMEVINKSTFGRAKSDKTTIGAFRNPKDPQGSIIEFYYDGDINRFISWYYAFHYQTTSMQLDLDIIYLDKSKIKYDISDHKRLNNTSQFIGDDRPYFD
jgi:hypothetical protein